MAEKEITEASVLSLVAKYKITASRGAELLAMSIWDFYDLIHDNGISLDNGTPEELAKESEEDRKTLRTLRKKYQLSKKKKAKK